MTECFRCHHTRTDQKLDGTCRSDSLISQTQHTPAPYPLLPPIQWNHLIPHLTHIPTLFTPNPTIPSTPHPPPLTLYHPHPPLSTLPTLVATSGPVLVSLPTAGLYWIWSSWIRGRCFALRLRISCRCGKKYYHDKRKKVKDMEQSPTKCSAWPEAQCKCKILLLDQILIVLCSWWAETYLCCPRDKNDKQVMFSEGLRGRQRKSTIIKF